MLLDQAAGLVQVGGWGLPGIGGDGGGKGAEQAGAVQVDAGDLAFEDGLHG